MADLRRYLEYLSSTVDGMRGPLTSDTEDEGDDDDISQLEDFITYPQMPTTPGAQGQNPPGSSSAPGQAPSPSAQYATTSNIAAHNGLPTAPTGQDTGSMYAPLPLRPTESNSPTMTIVDGSNRVISVNSSASASSVGIPTPDLVFAEGGASLHSSSTIRAHRSNTEPMSVSHPVYFASTSPHHVIDTRQSEAPTLPGDRALEHSVREALTGGEGSYVVVPEGGSDTDTLTNVGPGASAGSSTAANGQGRGRLRMLRGVADYANALPWRRGNRRQDAEGASGEGGQ